MTNDRPSGFVDWPDYYIDVRRVRNLIRVTHEGAVVAETTGALLVAEQDHGIVFYIPADDVRFDLLTPDDDTTSRCPFKGDAKYWRRPESTEPIAWEYTDPYPEVAAIRGHLGFYQDRTTLEVGVAVPAVSGRPQPKPAAAAH